MARAFTSTLLRKYEVAYFQCPDCGLLQTEQPYWLDEAYSEAIAFADTGLIRRNISIALKLASLIHFELESGAAYVDMAGGYGMLTRLMRDFGIDFYWSDKYCQNLLARGFEAEQADRPFSAITAFEALEHIHDPLAFVSGAMEKHNTRTLIFSTELYAGSLPQMDWWYFAFNSGQHISFYTIQTLRIIAGQLGLHLHSANGIHMLTDKRIRAGRFAMTTGILAYPLAFYVKKRLRSLTFSDHERMMCGAFDTAGDAR